MHFGAQLASIIFAALVFVLVFEMVRRRHLHERYAILWLGAAFALLVLAVWIGLLKDISDLVGIKTPSNAFFVIAFGFLLVLVLHFSSVVSKLSDESRVLAQRLALVEQRLRAAETRVEETQGAQARGKAGEPHPETDPDRPSDDTSELTARARSGSSS
jgi:hypothetical protein